MMRRPPASTWGSIVTAALAVAIPFLAPACSSSDGSASDAHDDAGADDVLQPPSLSRTQNEATLAPQRNACAFRAGAWPAETIGKDYPLGSDIPINHVIVIMQENRSFDHYLGRLIADGYYQPGDFTEDASDGDAGAGKIRGAGFDHSDQLDGPPPGWSNPDSNGGAVVPHADDQYCYGVNHSWEAMHDDYNGGHLDHF